MQWVCSKVKLQAGKGQLLVQSGNVDQIDFTEGPIILYGYESQPAFCNYRLVLYSLLQIFHVYING